MLNLEFILLHDTCCKLRSREQIQKRPEIVTDDHSNIKRLFCYVKPNGSVIGSQEFKYKMGIKTHWYRWDATGIKVLCPTALPRGSGIQPTTWESYRGFPDGQFFFFMGRHQGGPCQVCWFLNIVFLALQRRRSPPHTLYQSYSKGIGVLPIPLFSQYWPNSWGNSL